MSLVALKEKASNVATTDALNAIKGGMDTVCHDGSCLQTTIPTGSSVPTYNK